MGGLIVRNSRGWTVSVVPKGYFSDSASGFPPAFSASVGFESFSKACKIRL